MNTIKLWRLLKVIYFIITIPIIIGGSIWIAISQEIYRWNNYVTVNDYYVGILYAIIFVVSYIITTDIIRRIISYINHGNFKGFIPYAIILKKYLLKIIIGSVIISIILVALSQKMRNECTWENEEFNEQGICSCKVWTYKEDWSCEEYKTLKYSWEYWYGDTENWLPFGNIKIFPKNDEYVQFAAYLNRGHPSYNQWYLNGTIKIGNGNWEFQEKIFGDSCNWRISFMQEKLNIKSTQDNTGCAFWWGVNIDGEYQRLNQKIPTSYFAEDGTEIFFK